VTEPRLSISAVTTLNASLAEDLDAYRAAGASGIGLWELKFPEGGDEETLALVEASGLEVTNCVPLVPSILPLPLIEGPDDPRDRVDAICAAVRRLAPFHPDCVVLLTGPALHLDPADARRTVVEGIRRIAAEGRASGVRIGLEPMNQVGGEDWTMISSIPAALELLEEAGAEGVGLMFDIWHLWSTETLLDDIAAHAGLFTGVHVDDWREPTRSWADRVLPGDGVAPVGEILAALDAAGWSGPYDLEIFSDDGTFGNAYDDSLWAVPAHELARRGREAFLAAWREGVVRED
jgi:sugar phosphate isomerase/epimerase